MSYIEYSISNADINQWLLRLAIMAIGVGLGITLLVVGKRLAPKPNWLAIAQIALSLLVPTLVGFVLQTNRVNGAAGGTDWEMLLYLLGHQSMFNVGMVLVGLYILLLVSTTLTTEKIIRLKRTSQSSIYLKRGS